MAATDETRGPSLDLVSPREAALARARWRVYERPRFGWAAVGRHLAEVWKHRVLLAVLVRRDLKVRYRGSAIGFSWSLLNPLLLLAVYSLVFGIYMRLDVPSYPLYLLSGLLAWIWLSQTLTAGSTSFIESGMLISKSMFPPQLLPIGVVVANAVNFLLGMPVVLGAALFADGISPLGVALLPVVALGQTLFLVGLCLPLAAGCVLFRDVKFLVSNLVTFWFFLTPIVYTADLVPERLRPLLSLNPFLPFLEAWHSILYSGAAPAPALLLRLFLVAAGSFVVGVLLFEAIRERAVEDL